MGKFKKIAKGLGYAVVFFALYYGINVAVSFFTELAGILRYFPGFFTAGETLSAEQQDLLLNKMYALNGVASIITTVLMVGITALIFLFSGMDGKNILGMRKPKKNFAWLSYFGGVFIGVCLSTLINIIPFPDAWNEANKESVSAATTGNPVLALLFVFILAPFLEEFVFRGLMMGFIKKYWSITPAVILPALIFGIIHGNILQGLYTFAAALAFSYFRVKGNSFWCAFLAHCGFNMSNILTVLMGKVPDVVKCAVGLIAFIVVICGAEFVFSDRKKKVKGNN